MVCKDIRMTGCTQTNRLYKNRSWRISESGGRYWKKVKPSDTEIVQIWLQTNLDGSYFVDILKGQEFSHGLLISSDIRSWGDIAQAPTRFCQFVQPINTANICKFPGSLKFNCRNVQRAQDNKWPMIFKSSSVRKSPYKIEGSLSWKCWVYPNVK